MASTCARAIAYLKPLLSDDEEPALSLPKADEPVFRQTIQGLVAAFLVDEGDRFVYVAQRDLSTDRVTEDELERLGRQDLERLAVQNLRVTQHGPVFAVLLDGNFEASLLLVDSLWDEKLVGLVSERFVVTIPARDVLAFCDSASYEGVDQLRSISARVTDGGDHLLPPNLYIRSNGAWHVYAA